MAIESTEGGGFVITGAKDMRLFQVIQLRTILAMEIRTGMPFSRNGSPLSMLKTLGIVPKNVRTKKDALTLVDEYLKMEKERRDNNA